MELIETFEAKGRSNGARYRVEVYEVEVCEADAGTAGPRTYRLADGGALVPYAEGKFTIVQTGEIIYRI
jgi:hypothetical protein